MQRHPSDTRDTINQSSRFWFTVSEEATLGLRRDGRRRESEALRPVDQTRPCSDAREASDARRVLLVCCLLRRVPSQPSYHRRALAAWHDFAAQRCSPTRSRCCGHGTREWIRGSTTLRAAQERGLEERLQDTQGVYIRAQVKKSGEEVGFSALQRHPAIPSPLMDDVSSTWTATSALP